MQRWPFSISLINISFVPIHFLEHNEELLQEAEIIVTDFDLIAPHLNNLKKAKWVQGTWAGVDYLINHLTNKVNWIYIFYIY